MHTYTACGWAPLLSNEAPNFGQPRGHPTADLDQRLALCKGCDSGGAGEGSVAAAVQRSTNIGCKCGGRV